MIDNKGRLFGKINIIDLFILIVVIATGYFIITKGVGISRPTNQDDLILQFYVEESPEYAAQSIQIGGVVEDEAKAVNLGEITDIILEPGFRYSPTSEGELKKAYMEGYNAITLTTKVKGTFTENGTTIAGNKYNIGHSFTMRAGESKIFGRISSIKKS